MKKIIGVLTILLCLSICADVGESQVERYTKAANSVVVANEGTDTTCFPIFTTSATGTLRPKSNANLTYNSNTGAFGSTSFVGSLTGNANTATKWGLYASISGPSAARTYTFPNEDCTIASLTSTQTFTNKRVTPRVVTITTSAAPTPTSDSCDRFTVTALGEAAAFAAPTGTPTDGQILTIRIKDDGTGRVLSWNAAYRAIGVTLPLLTVASKTFYIMCMWNSADSKWDVLAVNEEL